MSGDIFSVSELNQFLRDVITAGLPRAVWICGEIQGYDRNRGRQHLFFELVEKDPSSHEVRARVGAVIWAGNRQKIEAVLKKAENAFELKDDIEVKLLCKVDFYPAHGAVRLIVENIDPVHTLGKIAQDRQKLIAELTAAGVLARNKQLPVPAVPLNIGLITAFDSAAYHDFTDELKRSGFSFRVFLARAVMQGKGCEPAVVQALRTLNALPSLDLIVVIRGGGSIAELSCFDSRAIALAVAASKYPVISGIGHEINTTVTDLAAHTYLKTPTAVAQFLTQRVSEFMDRMADHQARLARLAEDRLRRGRQKLKDSALRLQNRIARYFKDARESQVRLEEAIRRSPGRRMVRERERIERMRDNLSRTIHLRLERSLTKIESIRKMVELASPAKVLKRGFSITRDPRGRALRSADQVSPGEVLTTELSEGRIESTVGRVFKEEQA